MVRLLVKECADVNRAEAIGETPLFTAAWDGHEAVARLLVQECGADVNQADRNGETPLFAAAYNGHEVVVRLLVQECGADVNRASAFPLFISAYGGTELVVRAPNPNVFGWTALRAAAFRGHTSIVRYLVMVVGADAHELSAGLSVVDEAVAGKQAATLEELLWLGVTVAKPKDITKSACISVWQRFQHSQRVAECVYQLCVTDVLRHELFSVQVCTQAFHPIVQCILDYTTTTPPRMARKSSNNSCGRWRGR